MGRSEAHGSSELPRDASGPCASQDRPPPPAEPRSSSTEAELRAEIERHKQRLRALEKRIALEQVIAGFSAGSAKRTPEEVQRGIDEALAAMGPLADAGAAQVMLPAPDGDQLSQANAWRSPNAELDLPDGLTESDYPWLLGRLLAFETVAVATPDDVPAEARAELDRLQALGVHAVLALPMVARGRLLGALLFLADERAPWSHDLVGLLRLVGEVFAHAVLSGLGEQALRRSEERLQTIVSNVPVVLFALDRDGRFTLSEGRGLEVLGLRAGEVVGQSVFELYADYPVLCDNIRRALAGETFSATVMVGDRYFESWYCPLRTDDGEQGGVIGVANDVTDRIRAEEALHESEERFALAVCGANEGLWDWDLRTDQVYFSPRWREMLGLDDGDTQGRLSDWFDRVHRDDRKQVEAALQAHIDGAEAHFENEHRMRHADGSWRWMLMRGMAVRDEQGRAYRMAGSQSDTTERKRAEEQVLHDALHDPLTDLPNRNLLLQKLKSSIDRVNSDPEYHYAILLLDLDRFKVINDGVGHAFGDRLLIDFARRLQVCLRGRDTIARLGGDEFVVILDGLAGRDEALRICERIQEALEGVFRLDEREVFTSVSIGVVYGDPMYESAEELLRDADTAMYRAKERGRGRHSVFEPRMRETALARLKLETDLRRSVERSELDLYYQPICALDDGRIQGFEALIRWQHPSLGRIRPDDFIPLAEETGLIVPIGRWILVEACRQVRRWRDEFPTKPPLTMNVNLSSREFSRPDLLQAVRDALAESDLEPSALRVEITESLIMDTSDGTLMMLRELRDLGVKLSIDDFGTGYSSLSRLHRFPIDAFKIDRSFVHRLGDGGENTEIVSTIMTMAANLGMEVIAEGVETRAQAEILYGLGCRWGQGFHFSQPVHADGVRQLLADRKPTVGVAPHRPQP